MRGILGKRLFVLEVVGGRVDREGIDVPDEVVPERLVRRVVLVADSDLDPGNGRRALGFADLAPRAPQPLRIGDVDGGACLRFSPRNRRVRPPNGIRSGRVPPLPAPFVYQAGIHRLEDQDSRSGRLARGGPVIEQIGRDVFDVQTDHGGKRRVLAPVLDPGRVRELELIKGRVQVPGDVVLPGEHIDVGALVPVLVLFRLAHVIGLEAEAPVADIVFLLR